MKEEPRREGRGNVAESERSKISTWVKEEKKKEEKNRIEKIESQMMNGQNYDEGGVRKIWKKYKITIFLVG